MSDLESSFFDVGRLAESGLAPADLALVNTAPTPDNELIDFATGAGKVLFSDCFVTATDAAPTHFIECPYQIEPGLTPSDLALVNTAPTPDNELIDFATGAEKLQPWLTLPIFITAPAGARPPGRRSAFFPILIRYLAEYSKG